MTARPIQLLTAIMQPLMEILVLSVAFTPSITPSRVSKHDIATKQFAP